MFLSIYMTIVSKSFNKVTNFVKNIERVRKARKIKALDKTPKSISNFQGFYSWGLGKLVIAVYLVQSVMFVSIGSYSRTSQQAITYDG